VIATLLGFLASVIVSTIASIAGFFLIGTMLGFVIQTCEGQGAIGCLLIGGALGGGGGLGISVGLAQWLVLRRRVPRSPWWILVSLLGWSVIANALLTLFYTSIDSPVVQMDGTVVQTTLVENLPYILPAVAGLLIAATLMSVFQGLILRPLLRQFYWWTVLHIVLMLVLAALNIFWLKGAGGSFGAAALMLLFGPIYALATGTLLSGLARSHS
jgi:glucan phosphoethanolaminetransferase (alkaline phosphatase superfamily)